MSGFGSTQQRCSSSRSSKNVCRRGLPWRRYAPSATRQRCWTSSSRYTVGTAFRELGKEGGRGNKFSRKLERFFSTLRLLTLYKSPSVISLIADAAVSSFTDSITDVLTDSFIKANTHPGVLNSLRCRKDVIKPIF